VRPPCSQSVDSGRIVGHPEKWLRKTSCSLPDHLVNDNGRYRQLCAQPARLEFKALTPATEIQIGSTPPNLAHRCTSQNRAQRGSHTSGLGQKSDPGLLKQTSFIIHYLGWRAREVSGAPVRLADYTAKWNQNCDRLPERELWR
jgi:hypothetical protein